MYFLCKVDDIYYDVFAIEYVDIFDTQFKEIYMMLDDYVLCEIELMMQHVEVVLVSLIC